MKQMPPRPLQFSLRSLMVATAFSAFACANAGWLYRGITNPPMTEMEFGLACLSFVAIGGLLGAAIGAIAGKVKKWTFWGIVVGLVVLFFAVWPAIWGPRE
jgi:hypothetical protein